MLVVIVIVGILAVVSIEAYRKIIASSHLTEATNTVQAIRVAEEAYHAEAQAYYGTTSALNLSGGCPSTNPGAFKTQPWGASGSTCATNWASLPVHTDGPLMFSYAVTAGAAGSSVTPASVPVSVGSGGSTASTTISGIGTAADWYVIGAWNDYDGNGTYTHVYGVSSSSDLFVFNEGE
jgi:Tfp pilus assembly protein PilE